MSQQDIQTLVLLVSPILLVQLGIAIYSLMDLRKRTHVRGRRWVWALVLILSAFAVPSGLIAAALYLVWGRHPDKQFDDRMENDT